MPCMNRRFFTFGLGALLGAPKVSISVPAKPTVAGAHLKLATMLSRAHDNCSPEFLMRHLKIDRAMAARVQQVLIQTNVIFPPSVTGVSFAVDPMPLSRLSNSVPVQTNELVQKFKDKVTDELSFGESGEPDDRKPEADDTVPASHRNTDEVPSDLVTAHDRGGEDLV